MNSSSYIRLVGRTAILLAASMAVPASFGAATGRLEAQAQLLDHAEFKCANCFFAPSTHYYCFAVSNNILIGYQNTPVLNYQDDSKNYLTSVRPRWAAWTAPGQTVPISYDDKHIWVTRPDGKEATRGVLAQLRGLFIWASRGKSQQVRLTRSSMHDIFINNDLCRAAGKSN